MRFKIPSHLKRIYGSLNYQNLIKGLDYTGKIFKLTREIANIGKNLVLKDLKNYQIK